MRGFPRLETLHPMFRVQNLGDSLYMMLLSFPFQSPAKSHNYISCHKRYGNAVTKSDDCPQLDEAEDEFELDETTMLLIYIIKGGLSVCLSVCLCVCVYVSL